MLIPMQWRVVGLTLLIVWAVVVTLSAEGCFGNLYLFGFSRDYEIGVGYPRFVRESFLALRLRALNMG